jgi:hypothetical protein
VKATYGISVKHYPMQKTVNANLICNHPSESHIWNFSKTLSNAENRKHVLLSAKIRPQKNLNTVFVYFASG